MSATVLYLPTAPPAPGDWETTCTASSTRSRRCSPPAGRRTSSPSASSPSRSSRPTPQTSRTRRRSCASPAASATSSAGPLSAPRATQPPIAGVISVGARGEHRPWTVPPARRVRRRRAGQRRRSRSGRPTCRGGSIEGMTDRSMPASAPRSCRGRGAGDRVDVLGRPSVGQHGRHRGDDRGITPCELARVDIPSGATSRSTSRRTPMPSCSSSHTSTRRSRVIGPASRSTPALPMASYLDLLRQPVPADDAPRRRRSTCRFVATVAGMTGEPDVIDVDAPSTCRTTARRGVRSPAAASGTASPTVSPPSRSRRSARCPRAGRGSGHLRLGPRAHRLRLRRGLADVHGRRRAQRRPRRVPGLHAPRRSRCAGRSTSRPGTCSGTCPTSPSPTPACRWTSAPGWRCASATAGTRSTLATTSTASAARSSGGP